MLLQEFFVRIGAQTNAAQFAGAKRQIDGLKLCFAALTAIGGFVAYRLGSMTKAIAEQAKELDVASQKIGVNVEALQELQYAAKQTGADAFSLQSGMNFLAKHMDAASRGSKEDSDLMARLGVRYRETSGALRPLDDMIGDMADRFKAMPDGAQKAATAVQLFGGGGLAIIPMLNQGREGIAGLRKELRDIGGVMSKDTVAAGAKLKDTFDKMDFAILGLKFRLFESLGPAFQRLLDETIIPGIKKFGEWEERTHGLEKALKALAWTLGIVSAALALSALGNFLGMIGKATIVVSALGKAAIWTQIKMLAIPILVGAAFAAFLLILQDINYYLRDQNSLLGELAKKHPMIDSLAKGFKNLGAQVAVAAKWIEYLFSGFDEEKAGELNDFMALAGWGNITRTKKAEMATLQEKLEKPLDLSDGTKPWSLEKIKEKLREMQEAKLKSQVGAPISSQDFLKSPELYEYLRKGGGTQYNIDAPITINAAPGMDEEQLANKVKEKITETFSEIDIQLNPAK